ncbi:MAG: L-idonate 5-dehydrogenase [Solirubrobacterales bacterium]|nr:L-idonate 5-dehydrogenase [Solirubrobacterales bacterium]
MIRAVIAHGAHDLRVETVAAQPLSDHDVEIGTVVGGICGSDLHYYYRGGVGDFTIKEPLVLGHEIAGVVRRTGGSVTSVAAGHRVVIDPAVPCGICAQCRRGRRNLCTDVRFLGSAARIPHAQGGFRDRLVVHAGQCVPVPDELSLEHAVFAEPLAVAVHAVGRAGPILNRDVLITGAGPIGLLTLLVALRAGAATVTVTDICAAPLTAARRLGAAATINVSGQAEVPDADIAIDASGAPAGLDSCLASVRPGGRVVLVGLLPTGSVPVAGNRAVTREIELVGSFRFTWEDFRAAVAMLSSGLGVAPLLTGRFPLAETTRAFEVAGDRERALKVQLLFSEADDARGAVR